MAKRSPSQGRAGASATHETRLYVVPAADGSARADALRRLNTAVDGIDPAPYPRPKPSVVESATFFAVAHSPRATDKEEDETTRPVVGYVLIHVAGVRDALAISDAMVSALAVHPDWRGRGVATALLRAALDKLEEATTERLAGRAATVAIRTVRVQTLHDRDSAAWALYDRHGFRLRRHLPRYYPPAAATAGDDAAKSTTAARDGVELVLQRKPGSE